MISYAIRRSGQGIIVVIVVSFLTFIEAHLLPGNPARAILGVHASSAQIQAFDIENGYNKALPIQYLDYLDRLLHGNLGFSYVLNQSVTSLLAERLPATVILVGISVLVSLLAAIPLAVLQAVRRNRPADYVLTGFTFAFYSMPTFWLGLMFVMLLAVKAHIFPPIAPQGGPAQILAHPQGLVLPVLTLALGNIAAFSRYLRSSLLDNLAMDYVRTARAIGAGPRRVLYAHVFKNALAPVITLVGLSLPGILSGALITESIFNYPGMGMLYWNSALAQDYPVLLGVTIVVSIGTVAGSLVADLLYAVADPRIRYEKAGLMGEAVTEAARHEERAAGGEVTSVGSPIRLGAQTLIKNRAALVGLIVIVIMLAFSFLGPLLYHTSQVTTNLPDSLRPPGAGHPLGTDNEGYDELGRLMLGGQTSLEVGLAAAVVATGIGIAYGAISGFAGGLVDGLMMRVVDGLLAVPTLFLLVYLFTVFQASVPLMIVVIGMVAWLVPARLVRAETLSLRTREFVQAVRSMGGTRRRMIFRHIIPNTVGTIMVNATFQVADAILSLASLSFLGLGIAPPAANWGGMLSTGVTYTYAGDWWLIYPPGLCILLTVMAFNAVGDGLRDAFEVRLQRR